MVGIFGDGTIVGFDLRTGEQIGYLRDPQGERVVIDGLRAIFFGNGASLGRADFLYFTAGPNEETDGVFGSLQLTSAPESRLGSEARPRTSPNHIVPRLGPSGGVQL